MQMKTLLTASALILAGLPALAGGSGSHSHDTAAAPMPAGRPAAPGEAGRTIAIRMVETADGMGFEPSALAVRKGETIRLSVTNAGQLDHELVLGTEQSNMEHKEEMAGMAGDMMHDDPNALRLAPGEEGALVWTFSQSGSFQFACLIPGHMETGMHGPITVE